MVQILLRNTHTFRELKYLLKLVLFENTLVFSYKINRNYLFSNELCNIIQGVFKKYEFYNPLSTTYTY